MDQNSKSSAPRSVDTRTNAEFMRELEAVRDMTLVAKLRFMRNARNRDRAISVPTSKLSRLLSS